MGHSLSEPQSQGQSAKAEVALLHRQRMSLEGSLPSPRAPPTARCPCPTSRGTPCHSGQPLPTLSGPSPVPSQPPPEFPRAPPVFTGAPSSFRSRAAQSALRLAQMDRRPSHAATRAGWNHLACRAQALCARTSLGRDPLTSAGAPPTSAGTPGKKRGGPHFFACAPHSQAPALGSECRRQRPSVRPSSLGTARLQCSASNPSAPHPLGVFTRGMRDVGAWLQRLCQNLSAFLQGFLSELI